MKVFYLETVSSGSFWLWGETNKLNNLKLVAYKTGKTASWKLAKDINRTTVVTLDEIKHVAVSLKQMSEEDVFIELL